MELLSNRYLSMTRPFQMMVVQYYKLYYRVTIPIPRNRFSPYFAPGETQASHMEMMLLHETLGLTKQHKSPKSNIREFIGQILRGRIGPLSTDDVGCIVCKVDPERNRLGIPYDLSYMLGNNYAIYLRAIDGNRYLASHCEILESLQANPILFEFSIGKSYRPNWVNLTHFAKTFGRTNTRYLMKYLDSYRQDLLDQINRIGGADRDGFVYTRYFNGYLMPRRVIVQQFRMPQVPVFELSNRDEEDHQLHN